MPLSWDAGTADGSASIDPLVQNLADTLRQSDEPSSASIGPSSHESVPASGASIETSIAVDSDDDDAPKGVVRGADELSPNEQGAKRRKTQHDHADAEPPALDMNNLADFSWLAAENTDGAADATSLMNMDFSSSLLTDLGIGEQ